MSFSKINELRKLTNKELEQEILKAKKKLFELRFKKAINQVFFPHLFKHTRHKIKQIFSIKQHRKISKMTK